MMDDQCDHIDTGDYDYDTLVRLCETKQVRVTVTRLDQETIDRWSSGRGLLAPDHNVDIVRDVTSQPDYDSTMDEETDEEELGDVHTIDLSTITNPEAYLKNPTTNNQTKVSSTRSSKKSQLFSIFTLDEFVDRHTAMTSYYKQLRYAPYKCGQCDEATIEIKEMIEHFLQDHSDQKEVQYRQKLVTSRERWVQSFLDYQTACAEGDEEPLPNDTVHKFCPVCNHYDWKNDQSKKPITDLHYAVVLDKNHINKHLKYHPFACSLCLDNGRRYSLSMINRKAKEHLEDEHLYSDLTEEEMKRIFKPSQLIPELENFLRDYVSIIQENAGGPQKSSQTPPLRTTSRSTSSSSNHRKSSRKAPVKVVPKIKPDISPTKKVSERKPKAPAVGKGKNGQKMIQQYYQAKRFRASVAGDESEVDSDSTDVVSTIDPPQEKIEIQNLICPFCSHKDNFSDTPEAFDHIALHIGYKPVVCGTCHEKFSTVSSLSYHGYAHPEVPELSFSRVSDVTIESWIDRFMEVLKTNQIKDPSAASFCPVCEKLYSKPYSKSSISQPDIRRHVFLHLSYTPLQCLECKEDERFFSDIRTDAYDHLSKHHKIECDHEKATKYFKKSCAIEFLDEFIDNHFKKLEKSTENPVESVKPDSTSLNGIEFGENAATYMELGSILSTLEESLGPDALKSLLDTPDDREALPQEKTVSEKT
ncbi:uncharacterized protein LOC141854221 [Brevipalpus obovatus]|uniref:uncharacterized protein LOC141854221 n=1 Tax=Brevipalpus obovatus TaxID=246614 RepID=UPI003D9F8174